MLFFDRVMNTPAANPRHRVCINHRKTKNISKALHRGELKSTPATFNGTAIGDVQLPAPAEPFKHGFGVATVVRALQHHRLVALPVGPMAMTTLLRRVATAA